LFESLLFARRNTPNGRIREPGIVENSLSPAMHELSLRLAAMRQKTKNEPDKFELNAYAIRAAEIAAAAETLIAQSLPGCAYWIETKGDDDDPSPALGRAARGATRITFACSPIEVGPILKERLFGTECSVVLTSATLADGAPDAALGTPSGI